MAGNLHTCILNLPSLSLSCSLSPFAYPPLLVFHRRLCCLFVVMVSKFFGLLVLLPFNWWCWFTPSPGCCFRLASFHMQQFLKSESDHAKLPLPHFGKFLEQRVGCSKITFRAIQYCWLPTSDPLCGPSNARRFSAIYDIRLSLPLDLCDSCRVC